MLFYMYFCGMKHLIPIVGILLLASCHSHSVVNNDTTIDSLKEKAYKLEPGQTEADTGNVVKTEHWKPKNDTEELPCRCIAMEGILFDTTIFGHFSSSRNIDNLRIIAYSKPDKQYVNIKHLPKGIQGFELLDSIGWAWEWHIFLNGKLIDSTLYQLLYLEKLTKTMPDGRDAIAVVFDTYGNHYPDCDIMGMQNGRLTEFAKIGISIHRCMSRYIRKSNGKYMYYSIEAVPEDDSMVKYSPIKSLIAESMHWQY